MNAIENSVNIPFYPDYINRLNDFIDLHRERWWLKCRLDILVVADSFINYDDSNFGLSVFIDSMEERSTNRMPLKIDRVHRSNPSATRLNGATPNFIFDYETLKKYHQIWIFAADYPSRDQRLGRTISPPISDDERQAIRQFMDKGGGVFATGDHEDLGVTVGGYIPRVRSMRRWFYGVPSPAPQGEDRAPDGSTAERHDTNRPGYDLAWEFNDQSDDIPQEIIPKLYTRLRRDNWSFRLTDNPHPILCTPSGRISVLPDHPHEGLCEVPANLDATYRIGTDNFDEYPRDAEGNRVAPEVIADATILAGATASGKPLTPAGRFGVIGTYDGHRANVGRIVVDATWHHFININLVGDRSLGAPNPLNPKTMGFLHTPEGIDHFVKIKSYFYNIARWLSPNAFRRCIFQREIWEIIHSGSFIQEANLSELSLTGRAVYDQLSRRLGPCETNALIYEGLFEHIGTHRSLINIIDPTPTPRPQPDPLPFSLSTGYLQDIILGRITECMLKLSDDAPEMVLKREVKKNGEVPLFEKAINEGIETGIKDLIQDIEKAKKIGIDMIKLR